MSQQLLKRLQTGKKLTMRMSFELILLLALPAMLARISSFLMQTIDSAMVGRLGADASASIGLVASSTWFLMGLMNIPNTGYVVLASQSFGAREENKAKKLILQGLILSISTALVLCVVTSLFSFHLPRLLGADQSLWQKSGQYFFIYCLFLPFQQLNFASSSFLQASGDTKTPGSLNILMCFLDVIFNYIFIYGLHLNVLGAALGTGFSQLIVSICLFSILVKKNHLLAFLKEEHFHFDQNMNVSALKIGIPAGVGDSLRSLAYIGITRIVAPLGTVSIAANAFGITVESLAYEPIYGLSNSSSALMGQCKGAARSDISKRIAWQTVSFTVCYMMVAGLILFFFGSNLVSLFTPNQEVIALGGRILKIEAFAEPFYGSLIVCEGLLRGLGNTIIPTSINLAGMWLVRIPLSMLFVHKYHLGGVWFAIALQLSLCGILLLIVLFKQDWTFKKCKTIRD